jgi:hypothetical protein
MPILTYNPAMITALGLKNMDIVRVDFMEGKITHVASGKTYDIDPFYPVQKEIYLNGGLL